MWVTDVFAPTLGTIICNVMWLSPLLAVLEARRKRDLGNVNPVPFAVTVANCVAWTMYGCMRRDYFVFFSNATGLCLGLFYSLSAISLLSLKRADTQRLELMTIMLIAAAVFWCFMAMVACIAYPDDPTSKEQGIVFIGTLGMGFSLAYYGSPLSTMVQVVKKRDSSSLHLPMVATSLLNAFMWVIYGYVAKNDVSLWLPNAVGCVLCSGQLFMRLTIPAKHSENSLPIVTEKLEPEIPSPMHMNSQPIIDEEEGAANTSATKPIENPLHLQSTPVVV